jgi:hypothetical protein
MAGIQIPLPMNEQTYWHKLEYRVCRELDGVADEQGRIVWCDGFIPEAYWLGEDGGGIGGRVWVGFGGRHQEKWAFSLKIGDGVRSRDEIDWAALLPGDGLTGWLSMDQTRQLMSIDLLAASERKVRGWPVEGHVNLRLSWKKLK